MAHNNSRGRRARRAALASLRERIASRKVVYDVGKCHVEPWWTATSVFRGAWPTHQIVILSIRHHDFIFAIWRVPTFAVLKDASCSYRWAILTVTFTVSLLCPNEIWLTYWDYFMSPFRVRKVILMLLITASSR